MFDTPSASSVIRYLSNGDSLIFMFKTEALMNFSNIEYLTD